MQNPELIALLSDLIRINSVNPAYDEDSSEKSVQDFVRKFFIAHDVPVSEQPVLPGRPNVIAKLAGKNSSRRIIFEAHCDTAGIKGMSVPPFDARRHDGRIYGRGACDTKAGLAAMMLALVDLKRTHQIPASEVWVVSAVDEEHSYRGVWELRKGLQAAAAVVSEPTDMRMAIASKGCLRWRISTKGKASHSSKPDLGINAIEHMAEVVCRLRENKDRLNAVHHPLLGNPTLNVGLIQGGTQINVVPELCSIEIDRRLIPGEDPDEVFREYKELLRTMNAQCADLNLTFEAPQLVDWPLETPASSAIVSYTASALRHCGLDDRVVGVPFGSDASKLSLAGIPSIILGPGNIDQAHTADEFVELDQVQLAFEVYREIMGTFE